MNIFFKLYKKISEILQEIISYASLGYLKNILILIAFTSFSQHLQSSEIIISSETPSIQQSKIKIERYGDFKQRKAERVPFNRNRTLPTYTPESAYSFNLDELKAHIPEDFFKPKFNRRDIPDEALYNPNLKNDPVYKQMTTKKRNHSRIPHSTNFYAQYEEDPLPTHTHTSASSPSTLPSDYTYIPTKEILLLTALCNDWEDSYIYTAQILTQRMTHSSAPSLVRISITQ